MLQSIGRIKVLVCSELNIHIKRQSLFSFTCKFLRVSNLLFLLINIISSLRVRGKREVTQLLDNKYLRECSKRNHILQAIQTQKYFAVNILQKNLLK